MTANPQTVQEIEAQIAALQKQIAASSPEQLAVVVTQLQTLIAQRDNLQAQVEGNALVVQGREQKVATERSAIVDGDVGGHLVTGDNNSVSLIRNIYQQAPGTPALDEKQFDTALGRYLAWVERRYGRLNLRGVEKREQQVLSLTLDDVYVSLAALVNPQRKRHGRPDMQLRQERVEPMDMSRLLPLSPRIVITGGPGCGKTTYLHLIAGGVARAMRLNEAKPIADHLGLTEPLPLPIVVSLSEFNRYRRRQHHVHDPHQGTLIRFVSHSLIRQQAAIRLPDDFFERLLVQGRACLLLLDGLDEVANERERVLVARAVENLAYNDGVRQIVVTSRTRAYQGQAVLPEEFRAAAVQPMSPDQVDALAGRWCTAVYDETEAAQETTLLQGAITGLERLREARNEPRLADTPLMVTIIAIVHYNQRRLPEQRAELYEKCVEVLLTEKHKPATEATFELADWGGSLAEKRGLLGRLAYQMMQAGEDAGRQVSESQLKAWLRPRLARLYGETEAEAQLTTFIRAMRERESLLDERGGSYQFTHLTFQEFLCAYHLAENVRDPQKMAAFLAEKDRLADAWWRETALLTAGYLGLKSLETALDFLHVLTTLAAADEVTLAAAELAATAFLELDSQDAVTKRDITKRLAGLLTDPALQATAALRMLGGDALGLLGDPRPGVCTLEPELLSIAAGRFLMGEAPYEIEIEQPFAIARYPVTNAQFRFFIEDGGYTAHWRQCWTKDGWRWKSDRQEPWRWDDATFGHDNQPVIGVSWYEAVAYANWLAATTGKPYRLPTEAQWERAARHTDGRTYPWGEAWRDGWANTKEAGLERTTAVGVFPQDTAVCGAQDMGGNVGEWCQTRWNDERGEDYLLPYKSDDGRENLEGGNDVRRCIYGGVYAGEKRWSRCSARDGYSPDLDYYYYGFRVVLSPFSDSGR
jgi:formylglycine-generating enzyme required for sulfatase activity